VNNFLDTTKKYLVVGDVHGCVDELKALLIKNNILLIDDLIESDISVILLGDFVDKASHQKLKEALNFIYKNRDKLLLVRGNHEWMVYRYITGDASLKIDEKKDKYYNTASLLEKNQDLKKKFLELYDQTYIWLKYEYSDSHSYLFTHAPCQMRYFQKSDEVSVKKMVKSKSRSKNRGVLLDELISYVHLEAQDNKHFHIFGHLSQPDIRRYKNRICIDTACIYDGQLSSVLIDGDTMVFESVAFMNLQKPSSIKYDLLFSDLK
jgi:hypothetical protein